MENLLEMFEDCSNSPAYIALPQDAAAFAALRDKLQTAAPDDFLKLEALANAYGNTSALEGFINGWTWAQATAKECIDLRRLPVLTEDPGPGECCGACHWFVQHYRYTGAYPWYEPVGCGHCTSPKRGKKMRIGRDPEWQGCADWEAKNA